MMKYNTIRAFCLLLLGILFLPACIDVGEPDLSDDEVTLVTPVDNYATSEQFLGFFWEMHESVLEYNLQIAYPSFTLPQALVLDTTLSSSNFETVLQPGEYEWRVIGKNNFSETSALPRKLYITSDSSLATKYIQLLAPSDQSLLATGSVSLLWQAIPEAAAYRVQVASPDFTNSTFIVQDELLTTDNLTVTLADGDYLWRVRAENTDAESPYNSAAFRVDTQGPDAPLLVYPNDSDTLASPLTLTWNRAADAVFDSVYIYSDNFITLVEKAGVSSPSYTFSNGASGNTYFWHCRSLDAAANVGAFSTGRKFVLQ